MTAPRDAIHQALTDAALQAALDANAQRRRTARARAHASLPEPWEVLRKRAARVRDEILAQWDGVFAQFVGKARQNGFHVHLAATAEEARAIVLQIVNAQGPAPRRIVKSKSMVTEEIGLNAALEAAGHHVVETDLGEFIIQLRGERPAHIITPAVHLRRQEVAQTFHQKLGMPYTEDVEAMTATARRHLREAFLQADVGISGVNFGIAQTGGLCIVTNEGNGRMVTTLPRVHIAVMGAERLVRTPAELALMLELLPRSATGQDLTVYTSLIHGPRRPGDPDGPQERHLVIVDNGRRRLSQTPLADALRCIRCGACLNTCPVFQEIGGHAYLGRHGEPTPYPGPIGIVISPGLFGAETFGNLPYLCTLCGACAEACPVEVPLPDLILRARAGFAPPGPPSASAEREAAFGDAGDARQAHRPPWRGFLALYAWVATRPRLFALARGLMRPAARVLAPFTRIPFLQGVTRPTPPPPQPARRTSTEAPAPPRPSAPEAAPAAFPRTPEALARKFIAALTALQGEVITVADEEAAGQALAAFLQREGLTEVLSWAPEHLPAAVVTALRDAGVTLVTPAGEPPTAVANYRVGLTAALAGIAATGSLITPGGAGRPQVASLLPEIHLAVLPAKAIVPDLTTALQLPAVTRSAMTSIITGPSRTADIEMTLTIGVHGPKRVVVFLIE